MARQAVAWLHFTGYHFLLRRTESALLRADPGSAGAPAPSRSAAFALGCLLAAIVVAGYASLALLRPQPRLDRAQILLGTESGALYVRVGEVWHPVLNLASARLIAATDANPQLIRDSSLANTKRGALLGIPGAPASLGRPLSRAESVWTICDSDAGSATTVLVGPVAGASDPQLGSGQALLVAPTSGSPAYLLYDGRRAVVDAADPAVRRALRLEGRTPIVVSQALLNAIPEVPPIGVPGVRRAGAPGPAGLSGFSVGTVLRIARGDGDEYYVVLDAGVQRIGQVAADLLRLGDSQGTVGVIAVAPDVIRATKAVDVLPVSAFPDRAPSVADGGGAGNAVCVTWTPTEFGHDTALSAGGRLPVPPGRAPVRLAQADGRGPAMDAVYLPPGRVAYVRAQGLTGDEPRAGTRYVITDTGVRFAVHDDDAERALGLPTATPAAWPMLSGLPSGPELSRENASVAHDGLIPTVAGPP